MNKALQALAAVVVILVLLLAPVALFPDAVTDFVDDVRRDFVEKSLVVAELKHSVEAAENGDLDAQYLIALYHINPRQWKWHENYEKAFGPKDREKGERMMDELAAAGHPDALYWTYRGTDDEEAWRRVVHAGSHWVLRDLHRQFVRHPCNDSLYAHVEIVRSRLQDPDYPWQYPDVSEHETESHRRWKRVLMKDVALLDSIRVETCTTG